MKSFKLARFASRASTSRRLLARLAVVIVLIQTGTLVTATMAATGSTGAQEIVKTSAWKLVVFADTATDGVLAMELPAGAYDAFARDQAGYVIPPVIRLAAGDRIEITNNDSGTHMVFYSVVTAGTTATMQFDTPGTYVYSSGCAVNPRMNSFTTVIVSA